MQRRTLTADEPTESTLEIVQRGLEQVSWIRAESVTREKNVISARVGRAWGFWTATLAVSMTPDGRGGTLLAIESRPRSRLGLVDCGEGIHNVEELTHEIRGWLRVSGEA
jgi:hypothetical protein